MRAALTNNDDVRGARRTGGRGCAREKAFFDGVVTRSAQVPGYTRFKDARNLCANGREIRIRSRALVDTRIRAQRRGAVRVVSQENAEEDAAGAW